MHDLRKTNVGRHGPRHLPLFSRPCNKNFKFYTKTAAVIKNLITAAVLLIVNPASAGYTIDIPKGTPQGNTA